MLKLMQAVGLITVLDPQGNVKAFALIINEQNLLEIAPTAGIRWDESEKTDA